MTFNKYFPVCIMLLAAAGTLSSCKKADNGNQAPTEQQSAAPTGEPCPAGYERFENEWYSFCKPQGFKPYEIAAIANIGFEKKDEDAIIGLREYVSVAQFWTENSWAERPVSGFSLKPMKPKPKAVPPPVNEGLTASHLPPFLSKSIQQDTLEHYKTLDGYQALLWQMKVGYRKEYTGYDATFLLPDKHLIVISGNRSRNLARANKEQTEILIETFKLKKPRPVMALTESELTEAIFQAHNRSSRN